MESGIRNSDFAESLECGANSSSSIGGSVVVAAVDLVVMGDMGQSSTCICPPTYSYFNVPLRLMFTASQKL